MNMKSYDYKYCVDCDGFMWRGVIGKLAFELVLYLALVFYGVFWKHTG